MFDKSLISDELHLLEETLQIILDRTAHIKQVNDFLTSPNGMTLLDSVCMKLLVVGETVKAIDKHTKGTLLSLYPSIPWSNIMGMRDIIAHHYFDIDANQIFNTIQEGVPSLLETVQGMKKEISNQ